MSGPKSFKKKNLREGFLCAGLNEHQTYCMPDARFQILVMVELFTGYFIIKCSK